MAGAFVEELAAALPERAVVTDPDVLETYRWDRTTWIQPGYPAVACFPTTTEQVAAAVKVAATHRVPIVPRGAGSSLCGGSAAIDGCVVVCLERMNRLLEIDPVDQVAVVEPGVINADVSAAAADHGLFYPPDPASQTFCSIGGNVATNAGGLCCVKYGVTRDYVLALEAVLADGTVLRTGRKTIKAVAGYDLTSLLVGSEGTLAIVTRIELRLRPAPGGAATMVAFFPSLPDAGRAVTAITKAGLDLSLLEIVDQPTIRVVDAWRNMGLDRDAAALLLAQSDAPEPVRRTEVERAAAHCEAAGASYTAFTADPEEADALVEARRLAGPALERLGDLIWEDVGVPRSRIAELLGRVGDIADRHGADGYTFGHAGDGNLHPTLLVPHGDADARARALGAFEEILDTALDLGGTITGEHGVGLTKLRPLERELGRTNLRVQRLIKQTLDPDGLLNPGKAL